MHQSLSILLLMLLPASAMAINLSVRVEGLERALETNVRAYLSVEQEKSHGKLTQSRLDLLHKRAPDEIRQALRPFGYFEPTIESSLDKELLRYTARYQVDPGPRVIVETVDFQVVGEGAGEPSLTADFPLAEGQGLDLGRYEKAKQSRLSSALQLGYLDAHYTEHEVRVDRPSRTARIRLHLDSGMRFLFGEIRMRQDILDPEFLARYLSFGAGDPYSNEKLLGLQSDLIDSEYFKQVEVNVRRDQVVERRIPVEIQLTPNRKNRYRIGLGFSTDTGPRMTLDWKRRRFGREGRHMHSVLRLSRPESSLSSEYIIPLERPKVDYLSFGATIEDYDTDTNEGSRVLLNASHSVARQRGWRRTLSLNYLFEDFIVGSQDDNARLLVPGVTWARIKGDSRLFNYKGKRLELHLEGAADKLLSTTSYVQLYTTNKFIHGLNDDWRVLARLELGATWADEVLELPPSKRFYTSDDNSIRGFSFEELGPRDENGEVLGGRYLAVGSLELERRLGGRWSAAVFVDGGNAYDPDYRAGGAYGAGLGIRWRSPVGPIRLDLARGSYLDEHDWRAHLVLGPEL
ncbi:MAG: autotransporter assembly complex protein TamA [Candidatus Thiodiazotropha sp.]